MTFEFDVATNLDDRGDNWFDATIEDGWDINGNANGGYLLALVGAAMRTTSGRPDPVSVTGHYLAPGTAGPVTIHTTLVKAGRQLVTVMGSMWRGERELLRVIGTFGDIAATTGGFTSVTKAPPDLPPFEQCARRAPNEGPVTVSLLNKLEQALRPEHAAFARGERTGVAEVEGWAGFADGRPIDTLALLLIVDAFPPPVFNLQMPAGWVPTVELTAHIRGIPAPGRLRCRFSSEVIQNGFLQEDGEVWDSAGQLVAQSRQLALLPRG